MVGYILLQSCTTTFVLASNKALTHVASGKRIVPERHEVDAKLKFQKSFNDPNARHEQTQMFSTMHLSSGKC